MLLLLLVLLIFPSAICQQKNPFAAWQNQQQTSRRHPAFAATRRDATLSRVQAIYGIAGQRNANQKLRTCCRRLKSADIECRRRFCDFNALRPEMVIGFMAQCAPRGPTVGQMWDCASSRFDHRPCCRQQGVIDQCLVYCETTNGVPTDYLKYIVCLGQFDKIRACFRQHLETHPNLHGDT